MLSDGRSDISQRPLVNALVYCPQGVLFLKVDDENICEVGEENVVQFVPIMPQIVSFEKMIALDLLLHNLAKFSWVSEAIHRGKMVVNFIINYCVALILYRKVHLESL